MNITCIYIHEKKVWQLWLTEVDKDGDWEIQGFSDGTKTRLGDDFMYLRNQLLGRSDPIPSRKKFKRRR